MKQRMLWYITMAALEQSDAISFLNLGLCGSPRLLDVGGVPYLIPVPDMKKVISTVTGHMMPNLVIIKSNMYSV